MEGLRSAHACPASGSPSANAAGPSTGWRNRDCSPRPHAQVSRGVEVDAPTASTRDVNGSGGLHDYPVRRHAPAPSASHPAVARRVDRDGAVGGDPCNERGRLAARQGWRRLHHPGSRCGLLGGSPHRQGPVRWRRVTAPVDAAVGPSRHCHSSGSSPAWSSPDGHRCPRSGPGRVVVAHVPRPCATPALPLLIR
jgi:hypothetical protein